MALGAYHISRSKVHYMHYRFFISYQHEDVKTAKSIENTLKSQGHYPYRDESDLMPGAGITPSITKAISRSHFLLLLVTKEELWTHAWVQQEIGFAVASSVKVIPVIIGNNKDSRLQGMIDGNAAIIADNIENITISLSSVNWKTILRNSEVVGRAVFNYVNDAIERPKLIAKVAEELENDNAGKIVLRLRSGLSSFSLPTSEADANWAGINISKYRHWFYPHERKNIQHISGECPLIIDPNYPENFNDDYDLQVQIAKLKTLREFLANSDERVRVVRKKYFPGEGVILLGNHWCIQSAAVGPTNSVRSALYTWHAPTIDEYCKLFDDEFSALENEQRVCWESAGLNSRSYAIV